MEEAWNYERAEGDPREFGYREELERLAAEVPWFKFVATINRPWEDAAWKGETGRVHNLV